MCSHGNRPSTRLINTKRLETKVPWWSETWGLCSADNESNDATRSGTCRAPSRVSFSFTSPASLACMFHALNNMATHKYHQHGGTTSCCIKLTAVAKYIWTYSSPRETSIFLNEVHENMIKDCQIWVIISDEGVGKKFINGTISGG